MKYNIKTLANMIDHTNLKPYATDQDMKILCDEAIKYGFKMVAINPIRVAKCQGFLKDSSIHVGAAIGFPLGENTIETKVFETINAINNGADEIDYVINIGRLKDKDYDYITKEMQLIVGECRKNDVISKVIFENCYLTTDEIVKMCEIALVVKPDYIKTSTGFGTGGATFEDVSLMKSIVKSEIKVKAAGGIKDTTTFIKMVQLGVDRVGTSSGVNIIEELLQSNPSGEIDL